MQLLEERIRRDGIVREGNVLKVDSFLNHQIDVTLLNEMGRELLRLFGDDGVTKILTIEASGIGIACIAAQYFNVPVVFAKKAASKNISGDVYTSRVHSFTKDKYYDVMVSKDFLYAGDRVLIIDDFLAKGAALIGLCDIINQAGATVVGAGIAIEKAFQDGGKKVRDMGIRVESLARVASMSPGGGVVFAE